MNISVKLELNCYSSQIHSDLNVSKLTCNLMILKVRSIFERTMSCSTMNC